MSESELEIRIRVPAKNVNPGVLNSILRDYGAQERQLRAILNWQDANGNRRSTENDMRIDATLR
jgi:hypothetical protein